MPNKITLKTIEDLNNNECRFPLGKEMIHQNIFVVRLVYKIIPIVKNIN